MPFMVTCRAFCVRSPGGGLVAVGEAGIGGVHTGDVYLRFQYQQGELMGERQIECLTAGTFRCRCPLPVAIIRSDAAYFPASDWSAAGGMAAASALTIISA